MTPKKFDGIVTNLANARVQKRIEVFNQEIKNALKKLHPDAPCYGRPLWFDEDQTKRNKEQQFNAALTAYLIGKVNTLPAEIWREEEARVEAELLAQMDVMAQALRCAEPTDTDVKPGE